MLVKTHAIVLSRLKYGEADLIVKCYTLSEGIKSYILRGVLKSRKGKFRVAYFQPLTILQLDADHKPLRDLNYIREVKLVVHPVDNTQDVVRGGIVMFLSEVLTHVLKEEESNPLLFEFLETSIHWLNETDYPNNFHLKFLIELTKYLGFYPDIPDRLPSEAVFDLQEGMVKSAVTGPLLLSTEKLTLLKTLLGTKFDVLNELRLTITQKRELLQDIMRYFELHLHGFKQPKSLGVLNQVFG